MAMLVYWRVTICETMEAGLSMHGPTITEQRRSNSKALHTAVVMIRIA